MDFKIPTKPYLKRYLHFRYPQPYRISLADSFGVFLYHILRRQTYRVAHQPIAANFSVKYSIKIGKWYLDSKGVCYLTNSTIVLFNNFVESMLREELYKHLESCELHYAATAEIYNLKTSPFTTKAGILNFLDKYNIDQQELSYQTLKKDYYRYKLKKQNKLPCRVSPNKKGAKASFTGIRLSA